MKKRTVKKWVNRYVTPLLDGFPRAKQRCIGGRLLPSVVIINGETIPEGNVYAMERDPRRAIRMQIEGIRRVLDANKGKALFVRIDPIPVIRSNQKYDQHPDYWRKNPRLRFCGIYTRLLVDEAEV